MTLPPPTGRQHATGFVHQKIGSRKVPVVTVGTCDCDVAIAVARPEPIAAPASEHAASSRSEGFRAVKRSTSLRGPATRELFRARRRRLRAIGAPLQVAPRPAIGHEELIAHRRIKAGGHRPAVVDKRHRDTPIRQAGQIGRASHRSDRQSTGNARRGERDRRRFLRTARRWRNFRAPVARAARGRRQCRRR